MNKKFITIFFKDDKTKYLNLIIDFFKGLVGSDLEVINKDNNLAIIFNDGYDVSFEDIASALNTDFYIDSKLYESDSFSNFSFLHTYLEMIFNLDLKDLNTFYFNNSTLIVKNLGSLDLIKRSVLKKYYEDYAMQEVIKVYLECNMNISKAATNLYMHRNTVMNKIDKFIEVTGYDIKSFKAAFVIYHLF